MTAAYTQNLMYTDTISEWVFPFKVEVNRLYRQVVFAEIHLILILKFR